MATATPSFTLWFWRKSIYVLQRNRIWEWTSQLWPLSCKRWEVELLGLLWFNWSLSAKNLDSLPSYELIVGTFGNTALVKSCFMSAWEEIKELSLFTVRICIFVLLLIKWIYRKVFFAVFQHKMGEKFYPYLHQPVRCVKDGGSTTAHVMYRVYCVTVWAHNYEKSPTFLHFHNTFSSWDFLKQFLTVFSE